MFKVKFADIGEGLTEGVVTEVFVKTGEVVKNGQALFNVETDKVNSDIFSPTDGIISNVLIKSGQEIKVGDVVIEIDDGKVESVEKEKKVTPVEENASVVGATPVSNDLIQRGRKRQIPLVEKVNSILESPKPFAIQNGPSTELKPAPKYISNNPENHYDVIMVGAGVGGYVGAIKCSRLGLKTLIIEKEKYGGVCLNIGCIPTKTLLKSADLFEQITKAEKYGIKVDLKGVKADWESIQKRKTDVVSKLTSGVKGLLKKNNVTIVEGNAIALDKNTIKVNDSKYTCDNLIIATGSVPNSMNLPGSDDAIKSGFLIDSTGALELPKIPKNLVIIGGGVIGVEFACVYKRLGTKVTILQFLPTILEMLDGDVTKEMTKELINRGNLEIITGASTKEFKNNEVIYEKDGKLHSIKADYCLQSVGRKTVTTGFESIGLNINERNHIVINEYCETNIDGVYAIGDVTGKMMLAHVASYQGLIAANRIARRLNKEHAENLIMDYNKVPSCIYTHPEVAMIGKTEEQLKKEGIDYKAYKFPFAAIGKALADGNTTGFVKLICEPTYKQIIGAHIISNTATDMISEITTLMEAEGTITELAKAIHPHPTLSEAVWEAAEALEFGKPINF
ncbi:dihydrolipoyl dehydrogenase [Spiroplasma turonicum]|uniref:Dihydrolipoyl dehydrogenase n=1 Tax=Spiroplasma turonicum TaxID=216946 RepID=A0A0K1P738_9MOLU|nr:dihydrolipoyl dehydrogenase [Spiroplasma turonicum]AKU79707.1 pyruvate dehydrogenase E3 component [Spiroplasma turonicum]ALX70725.1 pyruvate dehydrogenase E3 component [Spiroplasma turonicum]